MPTSRTGAELPAQSATAVRADRAQTMWRRDFVAYHGPALERDEVKHNIILANLDRLALDPPANLLLWSLGAGGACAVQSPGYPIVLGDLTQAQCRVLAGETRDVDYPGLVGPEETAPWFAERAVELGLRFLEPIPQQIHVLLDKPKYPGAAGHARVISAADTELFADWTLAFLREAVPHDPPPNRERLARRDRTRLHASIPTRPRLCRLGHGGGGRPHLRGR